MEKVKKLVALELIYDDGTSTKTSIEEFVRTAELVIKIQMKGLKAQQGL